jgi:hypothetical protein
MRSALVMLAACWTGPPPAEPLRQVAPVCVPARFADVALASLTGDVACFGDGDEGDEHTRACVRVGLTGTAVDRVGWAEVSKREPPAAAFTVKQDGTRVDVCGRGTCRRLTIPDGNALAVSDDGRRVVAMTATPSTPAQEATDGSAQISFAVYDVGSGMRTSHFSWNHIVPPYGFGDASLAHDATFVGDRLIIGEWPAGPSGDVLLVDPRTRRAMYLHSYDGSHRAVDAHTLLVLDRKTMSIVDLDTISTRAVITIPGGLGEVFESSAGLAKLGRSYVVVSAHPPAIAKVDLAARTLPWYEPIPICR